MLTSAGCAPPWYCPKNTLRDVESIGVQANWMVNVPVARTGAKAVPSVIGLPSTPFVQALSVHRMVDATVPSYPLPVRSFQTVAALLCTPTPALSMASYDATSPRVTYDCDVSAPDAAPARHAPANATNKPFLFSITASPLQLSIGK